MAGLRIPALHGRSEELPAESSAGPESLDYWTSRMVALGGYRSNPLFNGIIGTVCPSRNAPCEPSHHPIKWRGELLPAALRPPTCRTPAVASIGGNERFPTAAASSARAIRKAGEYWRRLTSRAVEPSSARQRQTPKTDR